jgi:hypothetical protein
MLKMRENLAYYQEEFIRYVDLERIQQPGMEQVHSPLPEVKAQQGPLRDLRVLSILNQRIEAQVMLLSNIFVEEELVNGSRYVVRSLVGAIEARHYFQQNCESGEESLRRIQELND